MTGASDRAVFATNRPLRLVSLFLLYAAQGAPEGLLYVAVPAWLAAKGVAPEVIGGYIAIILLPWSLKLINGLLMDRIAFLPMGRRRPWIIGAQAIVVLTLIVFGFYTPDAEGIRFLIVVGFLVNLAGAFQDVAIDGMAIDIVPEEERARANGVMWGGKTLGTAAAAIVTGIVINRFGFAEAAFVTAGFVAAIMVVPVLVRERPGERLMPWSSGEASPEARRRQMTRWAPIASGLFKAITTLGSLIFAAGIFIAFGGYGLESAYAPVLAVQDLDWTDERYTRIAGIADLIGGLFGLVLCGIIADRLGARRALILSLGAMAALQGSMAAAPGLWATAGVFEAFKIAYIMLFVLMSVSLYATAMAICTPSVAATQFSIYMALLNLGTSFGAQRFGPIQTGLGYEGAFATAAAFCIVGAALFGLAGFFLARPETAADIRTPA